MKPLNLLPYPRSLKLLGGSYRLPQGAVLHLDGALPRENLLLPVAQGLQAAAQAGGTSLELVTGPTAHPRRAILARRGSAAPAQAQGYALEISPKGILLTYRDEAGLRAGAATLAQLLREYGSTLPCLSIRDYPDYGRRGVMLDVSRGRVPSLKTLLELVEHLAGFKINEFQLYTEHTFAYRNFEPVWSQWGPLTGQDILLLDARCRQLGIDLVPNQNSFGHLRSFLEYGPLKKLAEVSQPYECADGAYVRYPTTLAPKHPATLPFLRELYDELLPHFSSPRFNVGCDETWDLGRGQSKALCAARGNGQVYLDFLKEIYREVASRGRQMMFWGDIILHHPELISQLPENIIALSWGYEADHPFEKEASLFARSKVPFYVCPGTSTWMALVGRHDTGFANLRHGAAAGRRHGAMGFLNTDWGDGGHPQPLAVSYLPYLLGAALSWHASDTVGLEEKLLVPVLSRDIFQDPSQQVAQAAMDLGLAHRKLNYYAMNVTPLGTAISAPIPKTRELMCRDGLKYYARIPEANIRAAQAELETHLKVLRQTPLASPTGQILCQELQLATRMAKESCHIMLWQQALAADKLGLARQLAKRGCAQLSQLEHDFRQYWPLRNKGTTAHCSAFLGWRRADYRAAKLHFAPEAARVVKPKLYAAD